MPPRPENEPLIVPESALAYKNHAKVDTRIFLSFRAPFLDGQVGVRWSTVNKDKKLWLDVFEQEVAVRSGHVKMNVTPPSLGRCLFHAGNDVRVSFAVFQVQPDGTRKWNNNNGQNYNLLVKDEDL